MHHFGCAAILVVQFCNREKYGERRNKTKKFLLFVLFRSDDARLAPKLFRVNIRFQIYLVLFDFVTQFYQRPNLVL